MPSTRRDFLAQAGKLAFAAPFALPILQACLPTSAPLAPQSNNSVPVDANGNVTVDVSDMTAANPYKVAPGVTGPDGFGVIITLSNGVYAAFSQRCTHAGCPVDAALAAGHIHCSCHSSDYRLDGTVIDGPAPLPLQNYASIFDASSKTLKIKIG